jgi:mxaK protein
MRRRVVHALFGAATLAALAIAGVDAWRLAQAERIDAAIARASVPGGADAGVPEARFAQARALAASSAFEPAVAAHKAIVRDERGALRRAARYDLGNLYLREALRQGVQQAPQQLPLIELAKQSYRDLLREAPSDWDARYNLERALQLAPEAGEEASADAEPQVNKQRVSTTQGLPRGELP